MTFQPLCPGSLLLYVDCWSHHKHYTEQSLSCTAKHDGTADWWLLLSPADSAGTPGACWALICNFYILPSIPERKRRMGLIDDTPAWFNVQGVFILRSIESSTDMWAIFIYLPVIFIDITVPCRVAGLHTVLIPEKPQFSVTADICHAQLSINETLKPFSCCSVKINNTTFSTVIGHINYMFSISQHLLSVSLLD